MTESKKNLQNRLIKPAVFLLGLSKSGFDFAISHDKLVEVEYEYDSVLVKTVSEMIKRKLYIWSADVAVYRAPNRKGFCFFRAPFFGPVKKT